MSFRWTDKELTWNCIWNIRLVTSLQNTFIPEKFIHSSQCCCSLYTFLKRVIGTFDGQTKNCPGIAFKIFVWWHDYRIHLFEKLIHSSQCCCSLYTFLKRIIYTSDGQTKNCPGIAFEILVWYYDYRILLFQKSSYIAHNVVVLYIPF